MPFVFCTVVVGHDEFLTQQQLVQHFAAAVLYPQHTAPPVQLPTSPPEPFGHLQPVWPLPVQSPAAAAR